MTRAAAVIGVLALATPAGADTERWNPTTIVNAGVQAGPESPPGAVLLVDSGIGIRIRGLMWHVRGDYPLFAGRTGGGSSNLAYRMWDVRVGPTWWSCGERSCGGLDLTGGFEYLRIHETGGDVDPGTPPPDDTRRDYEAIVDLRFRFLRFGPDVHGGVELSAGLRIKVRMFYTGDHVNNDDDRIGAGLLLGLGFGAAF